MSRKDLDKTYALVQAGHAVAEFLIQSPTTEWKNGTLIYLGVDHENELQDWFHKLDRRGMNPVGFKEPDLDHQLTAIACATERKSIFSSLKLI